MGATTPYITFMSTDGRTVSMNCYYAGGDAIGYVTPIQGSGTATATSPPDFVLPEGIWTVSYQSGPATGAIRLWCNGSPGPVSWNLATVIAQAANSNAKYGRFRGGPKFRYSLVVEVALAA